MENHHIISPVHNDISFSSSKFDVKFFTAKVQRCPEHNPSSGSVIHPTMHMTKTGDISTSFTLKFSCVCGKENCPDCIIIHRIDGILRKLGIDDSIIVKLDTKND